ncbi:MAG: DUF996 domain-containing protein [Candidatus Bathyarchaeota archaeon]|nr:DUF996 domain-containing protein [Candidatus Bathyarchaeota archaeon]
MNVNFQYSKTLAIEGSVLLLLGPIPTVGWILAIIGVILLLKATKELSNYYQDESIHRNAWNGLKYYIVAIVALAVGAGIGIASFAAAGLLAAGAQFTLAAGVVGGLVAIFAGLAVAFAFYLLAAMNLRKVYDTLAQKTGEASFTTASTLLFIGAILTIIGVGVILVLISWIFIIIGFSSMKPKEYQPYPNGYSNGNNYTQPPAQPTQPPQA